VISNKVYAALALSFLASSALAQSETNINVPEITVLGDQEKTSTMDFVPAVDVLSGAKLERRKSTTLGETLSHETGVSSSFFGPNASRPVIRGLGGERIRVLQNGTGVLDASAASEDHAVAIDPLAVERIEIVRGAATLLYGSSAVGGVVNVITNRIPEVVPEKFVGKFDTKFTTVDTGTSGSLGIDAPLGAKGAIHLDGSSRHALDYRAPGPGTVTNSFNAGGNGAVGASYIGENGFVGVSFAKYLSDYGTVAEKNVSIHMEQQRYDFSAGLKNLGWIESLKLKNTYSNYEHREIESGVTGTTFLNNGDEARLELKHRKVADFGGVFGLQANVFDFEARGDEAFLPPTNNQSYAAFLFEEAKYGSWTPSFGLRTDQSKVSSSETVNFGASETKNFNSTSGLLGLMYALDETQSLVLGLGYTERAPNYQELFANGAHVATGLFEIGDHNLALETSKSVELSWRHKGDDTQATIGVFLQDFSNFISLSPKGTTQANNDGEQLPVYEYRAVDAELYGAELEVKHQMPELIPGGVMAIELKADLVHGRNKSAGVNLPRMTPMRESIALSYKTDHYTIDGEVQRIERQSETAPNETPTEAYHMVNAGLEAPIRTDWAQFSLYARLTNLFDVEAKNHISVLKELAPLPGRGAALGLQATF
jgi:iron complex outermembrane recepter protein